MSRKIFFVFVFLIIFFSVTEIMKNVSAETEDDNINFFLDKTRYYPRDTIYIEGWINNVNSTEIQIDILNPEKQIIVHQRVKLQEIHEIDHSITTLGREWNKEGFYQIRVSHSGESEKRLFAFGDFNLNEFKPEINLDKEVYSWTDDLKINIISPNDNKNNHQIDKIKIDISSRAGTLQGYVLEENGNSHGVFSGVIKLTGHSDYDFNQDGRKGDTRGYTGGAGPDEGNLSVHPKDIIKIAYSTPFYEKKIEKSVLIEFQVGTIQWVNSTIYSDQETTIRVTDPDMKLRPEIEDEIKILVNSDPQKYSKEYVLHETEVNSGIFEGKIQFDSKLSKGGVFAPEGSMIHAKYEDRTLPSSFLVKKLDIIANATITGPTITEETELAIIPPWVKNTAKWWAEGSIEKDGFLQGIQHLVKKKIIDLEDWKPGLNQSSFAPEWLKKNARWWSQGLISDEDFVKGIRFLIEKKIVLI